MNPKSAKEALSIAKKIQVGSKNKKNVSVVIAPPYPYIEILPKGVLKGAQDLFYGMARSEFARPDIIKVPNNLPKRWGCLERTL